MLTKHVFAGQLDSWGLCLQRGSSWQQEQLHSYIQVLLWIYSSSSFPITSVILSHTGVTYDDQWLSSAALSYFPWSTYTWLFSPWLLFAVGWEQASQQGGQNSRQLMRDPFQTVSIILISHLWSMVSSKQWAKNHRIKFLWQDLNQF